MKKASRNRQKQTNKRKKQDSQPASLKPSSQPSQPYVDPLQANSLPPTFPPQSTTLPSVVPPQRPSLPPNIPPPSTALPPGFPPLSTSLPPSFFSIPPSGTNTSLDSNIVPTPRINSSSSCHISQNDSSSSQFPSSTPTVSTGTTTASACSKTQNVGETREYDAYHRLILTPDEDGFKPSYAGSHMISESIQPFFNDAWGRWKEFPYNIREQIWNQFRTKCTWEPCYENKINSIFEKKARIRVSDMLFEVRKKNEKPDWLREEVWIKFLAKWNTPEF